MSAIFQKISMYLGATIMVIVAGIIVILLLTALLMKVEDFFFGSTTSHQVDKLNNEGANKNDENKEIIIYDENSK